MYIYIYIYIYMVGRTMAQEFKSLPFIAEARFRSQSSPCEILGGQIGNRTRFTPITSVFPFQYHSTSPPYSFHLHVAV